MDITYRKLGINDIDIAVKYRLIFIKELQSGFNTDDEQELKIELKKYFAKTLADNSYISYVAEFDGKIIGTSGMVIQELPGHFVFKTGRQGYILNMYSDPDFRGKGICTTLLKMLLNEAKKLGLAKVYLHSTNDGINIYKNIGFNEPQWPVLEMKI